MRSNRIHRPILFLMATVLSFSVGSSAKAQLDDTALLRARLDHASRELVDARGSLQEPTPTQPLFAGEKIGRLKHGLWSLLIPGWSQYRSGHNTRAAVFFGTEVAVWSSFAVFRLQGSKREDSYGEFAQFFANVESADHDEDYWRAVASYRSSDDYNVAVRRDERAGSNELGPQYTGGDTWRWMSEDRFQEFRLLRADSLDAYDRATFVTLFALINRVISFVDAVRSGGPEETDPFAPEEGVSFRVHESWDDPGASLSLRQSF